VLLYNLILIIPLFAQMTLEEKIGQLFMAPACPLRGPEHLEDWQHLIETCHVGSAILKQSDPQTQIAFLQKLQSMAPILIAADAEWGLSMRMSQVPLFPRNMTLGAIQNRQLLFEFGYEVGREAKQVGIHLNLAPVADVNTNPQNPVIGNRSFGDDPHKVAECVSQVFRGLEAGGVFACAKHFPGHGDTTVDSHQALPTVKQLPDLTPFKRAIDEGISAIMTAHILIPGVSEPMTLSPILRKILREELKFKGLIISDAMNMKAIHHTPEEAAILARKAGCDILLYGAHLIPEVDALIQETIPRAFQALKEAYLSGELDIQDLDESVERIMKYKEGIRAPSDPCLFTEEAEELKKRLFREAVTLIGEPPSPDAEVVFVTDPKQMPQTFPEKCTLCLLTTPYALMGVDKPKTVLVGYEEEGRDAVIEILQGKGEARGQLPVVLP
jgi:beta-glucosidase-like glycosyl hydrolase